MEENLKKLTTESRNPDSLLLDTLSPLEVVKLMNQEDQKVALAIQQKTPQIALAVEILITALNSHGRAFYFGAGTSGRLGVLDASEIPPTFSSTNQFIGLMAGGDDALRNSIEGAEDSKDLCIEALKALNFSSQDVAIAIAASGRTPYCIGGLEYARSLGAKTISITCNPNAAMSKLADVAIDVEVGPEVLTGSTRLKSGTAQKMVLNMLSTATMVGLGKTYSNLMVDVNPSNIKLVDRAARIIMEATGCDRDLAQNTLQASGLKVKTAIVMILKKCDSLKAETLLDKNNGSVRKALHHPTL